MQTFNKIEQMDGSLAKICTAYVAEKRALGYDADSLARSLYTFLRFSQSIDIPPNTLPKEVVQAWLTRKQTDSDRHISGKLTTVRGLAEYMVRMGYYAFVPESGAVGKCHKTFIPYIFTHEEIRNFFTAADAMAHSAISPRQHIMMPVLFRLLYCCGLRLSEALYLMGPDVDLENGVLTIRDSKFGKSRYVPMAKELTEICRVYDETRVKNNGEDWFFTAPSGSKYFKNSVYPVFRKLLLAAGIPHGGRGKGPRMHDFRHTFSVHCLQKWVADGTELTNAIPRLSAYLGHEGFKATEQYLRMTAEVYPEISDLLQSEYGYVVPQVEVAE